MQVLLPRSAPFLADVLPFRRRPEQWEVAVVCKATYALQPEESGFAEERAPIFAAEQWAEEGPPRLYAPRDLVPLKLHPEVVAVRAVPGGTITFAGHAPIPLAPPPAWPATDPAQLWPMVDIAAKPLGQDFDAAVFQYASPSQRLDVLPWDRRFVIERGHARHERLASELPPEAPLARLMRGDGSFQPILMRADLLWIDLEREVATVTWRGVAETTLEEGLYVEVGIQARSRRIWPEVDTMEVTSPLLGKHRGHPAEDHERTYAGFLPGGAEPQWLAPARSAAPVPPEESPLARVTMRGLGVTVSPDGAPSPSRPPPRPSQPAIAHPPLAGAPPPRPAVSPEPPKPAPIWSAEPRVGAVAPIAPNPVRDMIVEARPVEARREVEEDTAPDEAEPLEDALDVFWWDRGAPRLLRNDPVLGKVALRPLPARSAPAAESSWDDDLFWDDEGGGAEAAPPEEDDLSVDERQLMSVLRDGEVTPLRGLEHRLLKSFRLARSAAMPLVLVTGELQLHFDPRAELEVVAQSAKPLCKHDKKLASAVAEGDELLGTPLADLPDVAKSARRRIVELWRGANRDLADDFLERSARELLLQRRAFDQRTIWDDDHVRAVLREQGVEVPLYLPEKAQKRLPMFTRFRVRAIAELMPRQDERDVHPACLRAACVARLIAT